MKHLFLKINISGMTPIVALVTKANIKKFLMSPSIKMPMLGRWKITYEPKTINRKVDWANIDHCGCCYKKP
jgi:hypothetical protein